MEDNIMTIKENMESKKNSGNNGLQMSNESQMEAEVNRQMRIILKGVEKIIGEADLRAKIRQSLVTGEPLNIKLGLDPSAPDIHLGHAVVLRKIKQMQDLGHRAVIIIGDFTGRIGDPSGKAKGRRALTDVEIMINAQTYQDQIFRVLDQDKTQVRYNGEWLELMNLEEILRLARTTTVARMMEREDFKKRFRQNVPIGIHEFFYPLLQAYDSVEIEADIELGGTDQTFNILMGRSLQKDRGMPPQAAIFMPILEGLDGVEKMSKSLGNYIGVMEEARVMFKKAMEIPDRLIVKYFELATDILPEELGIIREHLSDGCNPRDVKMVLAKTITGLYHGQEKMLDAWKFYEEAFSRKAVPADVSPLQVVMEQQNLFDAIMPLIQAGMVKSGSELRRLLSQGGIQKNGEKIHSLEEPIHTGDILKIGKKRFVRLEMI